MKNPASFFVVICCAVLLTACGARKQLIGSDGIYHVKIGGGMPPANQYEFNGIVCNDSIAEEDEYSWRIVTLDYKKGKVRVEEDFFMDEIVNRIRVETPELHLKNGLKVGSTLADLKKAEKDWYIAPLPKYQRWDFYSRKFPRIHFLVEAPGKSMSAADAENWESIKIDDFSPESLVEMIVIF